MTDKNKFEQIPIYGKNNTIKTKFFDSLDEFNQYFRLHQEEIEAMTTKKLNKIYQIKDYKITRRKIGNNEDKTICFQLIKPETSIKINDDSRIEELENSIIELNNKLKAIEADNSKIKAQVLEIIKVINSTN